MQFTNFKNKDLIQNPLVSIWMVAFNHAHFIGESIEAVLKQITNFDFEIVVGDDFSMDSTREILLNYFKSWPNKIHLIFSHENFFNKKGPILSLEVGKNCRGKYIAFCEGDDYWTDPYKLQKQVDYLETHPACSICTHWVEEKIEGAQSIVIDKSVYNGDYNTDYFDKKSMFTKPNMISFNANSFVFRNTCIPLIKRMPISVAQGDSWILMSCLTKGYGFCIQEKMSVYRVNGSSIWTPKKTFDRFLNSLHLLIRVGFRYPHIYGIQALRKIVSAFNNFSLSEMKAYEPEDFNNSISKLKSKDPVFSKLLEVLLFTKMLLESVQRKLSKVRILIGSKI